MNVLDNIYLTLSSYAIGLYYCALILFGFLIDYIKNPFLNPWQQKLRLHPPQALNEAKYGMHKYAKVNNIKLHYLESGDSSKPLMIFVHGFPEFWYSWRHQIVEFNKKYWVVAVDMRGYGDSEKPEDIASYKLNLLVDDLRELLKHLGREKCIMVAHDWGSLVACEFRDRYPENLAALIVGAGASLLSFNRILAADPVQKKKSWYVYFFQIPYIPELQLTRYDLAMLEKMLVKNEYTTDKDIECYKYIMGKPGATTGPINYYRANIHKYVAPISMREENVPFFYALAEKDAYIKTDFIEYMKKQYKHIETTIVKDVGHFLQQENPEKFNTLLKDFLAKHNL